MTICSATFGYVRFNIGIVRCVLFWVICTCLVRIFEVLCVNHLLASHDHLLRNIWNSLSNISRIHRIQYVRIFWPRRVLLQSLRSKVINWIFKYYSVLHPAVEGALSKKSWGGWKVSNRFLFLPIFSILSSTRCWYTRAQWNDDPFCCNDLLERWKEILGPIDWQKRWYPWWFSGCESFKYQLLLSKPIHCSSPYSAHFTTSAPYFLFCGWDRSAAWIGLP